VRLRSSTAALAGGLALAAVLAPAASPARLASTLPIAYSDYGGDLFLGTADGAPPTTIFQNDGSTSLQALAITPDGSKVLALSTGDTVQLVLVPATGGSVAPISGTTDAQDGSVSPDGKSAIFSIGPDAPDTTLAAGIYSVPLGGGTPKLLVQTPDGATDTLPQLSPDGTQIAFARDETDSSGTEQISLELQPVAGGSPQQLASDVASTVSNGGRFSFSPDGRTIVFSGAFDDPGLYTVSVGGGSVSQLSSEYDYWPVFTSDGGSIVFSRDASSPGADDNQDTPVAPPSDPSASDIDELWTAAADGSNPTVVAEGDFEALAVAPYVLKGGGGGSGGGGSGGGSGGGAGGGGSGGGGGGGSGGGGSGGGSGGGGGTTKGGGATSVVVVVHVPHYAVTWKGKASSWKVTLHVGRKTLTAKVAGTKHAHTFTLKGGKGAVSATVKAG